MQSDLALLDYCSVSGKSLLHRSSPLGKGVLVCACVVAAWLSVRPDAPAVMATTNLAGILAFGGAGLRAALLLAYPVLAGAAFAVLSAPSPAAIILTLSRIAAISSCVILTMLTTPFHEVFGLTAWVLPHLLNETLVATYKSLFDLLERLGTQLEAARVRGVRFGAARDIPVVASALGNALLNAIDGAARAGEALAVRSSGSFAYRSEVALRRADWLPLGAAVIYLAIALALR
jgi:energy-coupling factor transporter transmembrane protein EcfT